MKQFCSLLIFLIGTNLSAQQLVNTTWDIFNQSGTFVMTFTFDSNSVTLVQGGLTFATYNENGNNYWIHESNSPECNVADTGKYTFVIQNDTLSFTKVQDFCLDRVEAHVDFTWVDITTSVKDLNSLASLKIYPNPTSGEIFITLEEVNTGSLRVLNSLGQVVLADDFVTTRGLDISLDGPSGLYFLQLEVDGQIITKKIVKR